MDLTRIIGSRPLGVSRFQTHTDRAWAMLIAQQGKAIQDVDLNAWQQIALTTAATCWGTLANNGLITAPALQAAQSEDFLVLHNASQPLRALVQGHVVVLKDSPGSSYLARSYAAIAADVATRTDLLYLDVWFVEVQPETSPEEAASNVPRYGNALFGAALTNDLVSPDLTDETSRRVQTRWSITWAEGATALADVEKNGQTYSGGRWGDGTAAAAIALGSVDGYRYGIPLVQITQTNNPWVRGVYRVVSDIADVSEQVAVRANAATVDGFSASATALANTLYPLDATGRYPSVVLDGSALSVDTVDGLHASTTPTALKLLPLNGSTKYPSARLDGSALSVDTVDTLHASAIATASTLYPLDDTARYPSAVLDGSTLGVDRVDGFHASTVATQNTLLPLNGSIKFPSAVLDGSTLSVDTVDLIHASTTPTNARLYPLAGNAKYPPIVIAQAGLDADIVDGVEGAGFALTSHTHGGLSAIETGSIDITAGTPSRLVVVATPGFSHRVSIVASAFYQVSFATFADSIYPYVPLLVQILNSSATISHAYKFNYVPQPGAGISFTLHSRAAVQFDTDEDTYVSAPIPWIVRNSIGLVNGTVAAAYISYRYTVEVL